MNWTEFFEQLRAFMEFKVFTIGETVVTPTSLLLFMAVLLAFYIASRMLERFLIHRVFKKYQLKDGIDNTIARLTKYLLMFVGILVSMQFVGINLESIAIVAGFLSVGIGFGLQNIASNFISGLILLFERPVKVGDRIQVADVVGDVAEIRMRSTIVNTIENIAIIIPNQKLIEDVVVNYEYRDPTIGISVKVGVAYGSDTTKVRQTLLKVAAEHAEVLDTPEAVIRFTNFGDSSLDFLLFCWIADPHRKVAVESDLRFAIDAAFREAKITIPFPQRDLHLITPKTLQVAGAGGEKAPASDPA